jgi:hypothetical protein
MIRMRSLFAGLIMTADIFAGAGSGHAAPPCAYAPVPLAPRNLLVDTSGSTVAVLPFSSAGSFSCGRAPVKKEKGRLGFINRTGSLAIDTVYENAEPFQEGICRVQKGRKYFLIDTNGAVIPDRFIRKPRFAEDPLIPSEFVGEKCGFLDSSGNPVSGNIFDQCLVCRENRAAFEFAHRWGFLDRRGEIVIPPTYHNVEKIFSGGVAVVALDYYRYACIDTNGRILLKFGGRITDSLLALAYKKIGTTPPPPGRKVGDNLWMVQSGDTAVFFRSNGEKAFTLTEIAQVSDMSYGRILFQKKANQSGSATYGFCDSNGVIVIPAIYEYASTFRDRRAVVKLPQENWGHIDTGGNIVIPLQFDGASSFSEGLASVRTPRAMGLIDMTGRELPEVRYSEIDTFSCNRAMVKKGNKFGFIDCSGKEVIPVRYSEANAFSCGLAAARIDSLWGFIDTAGDWRIEPCFIYPGTFRDSFLVITGRSSKVWNGYEIFDLSGQKVFSNHVDTFIACGNAQIYRSAGKWGFASAQTGIPRLPEFADLKPFSEGLAAAMNPDTQWGFIGLDGRVVIPFAFENTGQFNAGIAPVKTEGKWHFIRRDGSDAFYMKFDSTTGFSCGMAGFMQKGKWGVLDFKGRILAPPRFDALLQFREMRAPAFSSGKWGIIDPRGTWIIKPDFDRISPFWEGRAAFCRDGMWGYFARNGAVAIQAKYDSVIDFSEERAWVMGRDKKWRSITADGAYAIDTAYRRVDPFRWGEALVWKDTVARYIDRSGKIVAEGRQIAHERQPLDKSWKRVSTNLFDQIGHFSYGRARIKKDDLEGFLNKNGSMAIPPRYSRAEPFSDGYSLVSINKKDGSAAYFIDTSGAIKVELPSGYTAFSSREGFFRYTDPTDSMPIKNKTKMKRYGFTPVEHARFDGPMFWEARDFCEGRAAAVFSLDPPGWGIIDTSLRRVGRRLFSAINDFSEGMAAVRISKTPAPKDKPASPNDVWGFINKKGTLVIPARYDRVDRFRYGICHVWLSGKDLWIDTSGRIIWRNE